MREREVRRATAIKPKVAHVAFHTEDDRTELPIVAGLHTGDEAGGLCIPMIANCVVSEQVGGTGGRPSSSEMSSSVKARPI